MNVNNAKKWKRKEKLLPKNEEIAEEKTQTNGKLFDMFQLSQMPLLIRRE